MSAKAIRKLAYVHIGYEEDAAADGHSIFDSRVISELSRLDLQLECVAVQRRRGLRAPFWACPVDSSVVTRLRQYASRGYALIVSHEALFSLAGSCKVDTLIVHNDFTRFSYPGKPALTAYYRIGSRGYYLRACRRARRLIFLGVTDYRSLHALLGQDGVSNSSVMQPPPRHVNIDSRAGDLVHISSSKAWLPKRLGTLTARQGDYIGARGFRLAELSGSNQSGNGLITDRFDVGFKLQLMQMLYTRDVIASLVDLESEVRELAPEYPCYRTVVNLPEALDYFDSWRGRVPESDLLQSTASLRHLAWPDYVKSLVRSV